MYTCEDCGRQVSASAAMSAERKKHPSHGLPTLVFETPMPLCPTYIPMKVS